MITVDGSRGEGGGQVLRSSLALSMVTGQPFQIEKIRARRKKPGLLNQHLTATRAAAEVCKAVLSGDSIGSQGLTFEPGEIKAGRYSFAVGTAGSTTLVLQTVLPALMFTHDASEVHLGGGTHNPWAPPFDFLQKTLLPALGKMGPRISAKLKRPGFYPAGGGELEVVIKPTASPLPVEITQRGAPVGKRATAIVARLPRRIAEIELKVIRESLGWPETDLKIEELGNSASPGNVVFLEIESENITEIFTGFGRKGLPARSVADRVVQEALQYLSANAPVGKYLADQLLVPMALAGGRFRTTELTGHTRTIIEIIREFLDVEISVTETEGEALEIEIKPAKRNESSR